MFLQKRRYYDAKALPKRYVFREALNALRSIQYVNPVGSLFHNVGAAAEIARS
jgi:hypothetical protein